EERAGGVPGFQGCQGEGRGVENDGQLVIEVVGGGGGNGAGAVGVSQSFHTRMLAGEWAAAEAAKVEAALESAENKKMFASIGSGAHTKKNRPGRLAAPRLEFGRTGGRPLTASPDQKFNLSANWIWRMEFAVPRV